MRVGILGYGYMGTIRRRVLDAHRACEVVRIFHTAALPDEHQGLACTSWEAVVEDPDVDAVFVCLPNHRTREVVCRALGADKHVFAEKPPGTSVAEVEAMIAAERASGRVLKFGFNHRYHPAIREALARIAAGTLGAVRWARGVYGKPPDPAVGWRADPAQAGGGILLDQGIHMLDLLRAVCGPFEAVQALSAGPWPLEEDVMALLRTGSGQLASLHSSHTQSPPRFSLEVGLTGGALSVNGLLSRTGRYGPETLSWHDHTGAHGTQTYAVDDSWALEVQAFVDAVAGTHPVDVGSTEEALALMNLLASIYEAAGRPLAVH